MVETASATTANFITIIILKKKKTKKKKKSDYDLNDHPWCREIYFLCSGEISISLLFLGAVFRIELFSRNFKADTIIRQIKTSLFAQFFFYITKYNFGYYFWEQTMPDSGCLWTELVKSSGISNQEIFAITVAFPRSNILGWYKKLHAPFPYIYIYIYIYWLSTCLGCGTKDLPHESFNVIYDIMSKRQVPPINLYSILRRNDCTIIFIFVCKSF